MLEVNFYLKHETDEKKPRLIMLKLNYDKKRFVYTFNEKVEFLNWNKEKQRVKSNKATTKAGKNTLNNFLTDLKDECEHF